MSGTAEGPEAIVARARYVVDANVETEFIRRLEGWSGVTFLLRNTASVDGRKLDEHLAAVVTADGAKITRIDTYLSDVSGKNKFSVELGKDLDLEKHHSTAHEYSHV